MHFEEKRRRILDWVRKIDSVNDPFFLFLTAQLFVLKMFETLSDKARSPRYLEDPASAIPNGYEHYVDTGLLLVGHVQGLMPYKIITPWGTWNFAPTTIGSSAWPQVKDEVYSDFQVGDPFYCGGLQIERDDRLFPITQIGDLVVPQYASLKYNYGNTALFTLVKDSWQLHLEQFEQLLAS